LVIKILDPDPDSPEMLDPDLDPDSMRSDPLVLSLTDVIELLKSGGKNVLSSYGTW
jgi:hypothetical protein